MGRVALLALALGVALSLGVAVVAAGLPASDLQPGLRELLMRDLQFSTTDLADLEHGKIVRHTLAARSDGEVAAVGGVRVHAGKERFASAYRDITHFKRGESVIEIGRFSSPPELKDLDGLTITPDDFDLRVCRVGDCEIRLPADAIRRFQADVDWKRADARTQAAALFKQIMFDNVRAYTSGGPGRITQYDDDRTPILPVDAFRALLKNSPYVDAALPGLGARLASIPASFPSSFPADPLPASEEFLYWSKEKFGFAPFISVTHVTLTAAGPHEYVATTRDVYSSRYFDASLALVIASDSLGDPQSFYLFYVNRSRASALRGAFSRLRRSIVERRVRASLEDNLRAVKLRLEQGSN